jgi:hypothetical protein
MWVLGSNVSKNDYTLTFKMYRYDSDGNYTGYGIVRNNISINDDGTQYSGSGQGDAYDPDGNLLGSSCPSFTGVRLQ